MVASTVREAGKDDMIPLSTPVRCTDGIERSEGEQGAAVRESKRALGDSDGQVLLLLDLVGLAGRW